MKSAEKPSKYHILPVRLGNGSQGWQVYCSNDGTGKRFRKTFADRQAAEEELTKALYAAEAYQHDTPRFTRQTWLSESQVVFAENAFVSLGQLTPLGMETDPRVLLEAADFYLAHRKALDSRREVEISDAVDEFLKEKLAAGRRNTYLGPLTSRLRAFVKTTAGKVSAVTTAQATDYINRSGDDAGKDTNRRVLHNFLGWCVKKGYTILNPVDATESIKIDRDEPVVLTVEQCRKMLEFARDYKGGTALGYVVLGLFCALRPGEIQRLTWPQVDLESKMITIRGKGSKVRRRRVIEIPDTAIAWLKLCKMDQALDPGRYAFEQIIAATGFRGKKGDRNLPEYPPDAMRHTALSHRLGVTGDEGRTALWGGTSPTMIHRHYLGLVKPKETAAFWALLPN
jgi:integrase